VDSTDAASGPPKFVTKFNATYDVQEMQGCHLEARLTPAEDPHMNVSYFNLTLEAPNWSIYLKLLKNKYIFMPRFPLLDRMVQRRKTIGNWASFQNFQ